MEPREDAGTLTLTLETPSAAGDFVWAAGKGELRWPGRVRAAADVPPGAAEDRPPDGHCVYVAFFGDGGAAWCDGAALMPFRAGFPGLAGQAGAGGFGEAVRAAVEAFGSCLEADMATSPCVPEAALAAARRLAAGGFGDAEIVGGLPGEIPGKIREFARDASSGDTLEVEVVRSWIAACVQWMGRYVPPAEHGGCKGLSQAKESVEENPCDEGGAANGVEGPEDGGKKKQRSMAELIAGLDMEAEDGEDVKCVDESDASGRMKEEEEEEDAEIKDLNVVDDGGEEGSGTGRRERKKSKYLSYPYTLVNMRGRRMFVNPKSSLKKSGNGDSEDAADATVEDGQGEKTPRSRAAARSRAGANQDESEFLLDENAPPIRELLTELHSVALDVMCLEGSEFDHPIRGLFGRYRRLAYMGDDEVQSNAKSPISPRSARRTPGADDRGPPGSGKAPRESNGSSEGKFSGKGKTKKLSAALNGSVGAKRRSYVKKKSIGGIIKQRRIQESVSPRRNRAKPASQKAEGSDGGVSVQKRRWRRKEEARNIHRTISDGGVTPIVDASLEVNGTAEGQPVKKRKYTRKQMKEDAGNEGGLNPAANSGLEGNDSLEANKSVKKRKYTKKKKEQASNDTGHEQASDDAGLAPKVTTRSEAHISGAGELVENVGNEQVNGMAGSDPTIPAAQDLNVSGQVRSADIIPTGDLVNAERPDIPTVPVVQEGDGSVETKPMGKATRRKKASANEEGVPAATPKRKWQRKKKEATSASEGAVLGVSAFPDANGSSKPKQKRQRRKREEAIAADGAVLAVPAVPDARSGDKPKQKRQRKKKEDANAAEGAVLAVPAFSDASGGGKPKQKRRRRNKEEANSDEGAALLLSFSKDGELPSKEELISTYSKFGALRESGTALLNDSVSASVVFVKKSDAEKAFNSPDRDRAFGNSLTACQLRYLHGDSSAPSLPAIPASTPKLPLESVKKNLESMISTLSASGMSIKDVLGSDIGTKLDLKESLVDEMSVLLEKVNSMITGGPSSASGGAGATGPAT